jgi:hypothetical protein
MLYESPKAFIFFVRLLKICSQHSSWPVFRSTTPLLAIASLSNRFDLGFYYNLYLIFIHIIKSPYIRYLPLARARMLQCPDESSLPYPFLFFSWFLNDSLRGPSTSLRKPSINIARCLTIQVIRETFHY